MSLITFLITRSNQTPETTFFFFYNDVEPHQGRVVWMVLLKSKPRIHNLTHQNCVFANSERFFVEIKPRIFGYTTHPKPPNH